MMLTCPKRWPQSTLGHTQGIIVLSTLYLVSWWPRAYSLCPYRCLCDEETLTVFCDGASLDVVPITLNPGLQQLHLSNNRIKSIMAAFTVYRDLEYLDMAHNQLVSLGKGSFSEQSKLKVLNLNRNMISSLKNSSFQGLSDLKVLRLDENFLMEIPNYVFHPLNNLENMDLSQNRIASIAPFAFSGLFNLKKLLLRDNKLTQIPTASFTNVPSLYSLDLGLNSFKAIPGNAFYPLTLMKTLSLDGCGVQLIQEGAFKNLEGVTSLYLQDNDIQSVPIEALNDLPQLQELHLGQNRLRKLQSLAFHGLHALRTLTVKGGKELEVIETGAFSDNIKLERLIISHNRNLNKIEPDSFRELDQLRFVSLRGNEFQTFREDMLPWSALEVFDVRDNPLVCNCSVVWLWHLLRTRNYSSATESYGDVSRVICAGPPHLEGRALPDATLEDLDCHEESRRHILTGTVAGAGIVVALIVLVILWYRHRLAAKLEEKWKPHGDRITTPYQQHPDTPEEKYPPMVSHMIRSSAKVSPITEL